MKESRGDTTRHTAKREILTLGVTYSQQVTPIGQMPRTVVISFR